MNTFFWWAVPLGLLLVVAAWAVLRRRPQRDRSGAEPVPGRQLPPAPPAQPAPGAAPLAPATAEDPAVVAQRLAATEALRQARRRKAEDEARHAADRAAPQPAPAVAPSRPPETSPARQPADLPAAARPLPAPVAEPRAPTAAAAQPLSPPAAAVLPSIVPPVARVPAAPVVAQVPAPMAGSFTPAAPAMTAALPDPARPPALDSLAPPLNVPRAPITTAHGLAPARAAQRPAGPPTVLVADDSKVVRVKTGRLFERLGWRVLLADDGQAALRCLDDDQPDLLITDVEMPGLDGFALTRQLREHPRWARLPVIMITSSDDKHRDEALAAGVDVLLGKPYAEETLAAQAQVLVGSAALQGAPALH